MKKLFRLLLLTASMLLLLSAALCASAEDGISQRINALQSRFPSGMYWNHLRTVAGDDGDTLLNTNNNSYSNHVTNTPCLTHNGYAGIGQYDCNNFDHALQCYGFANKMLYEVFGQFCSQLPVRTDIANVSVGDHVRFTAWDATGHSAFVIGRNGDTLILAEAGYGENCKINWYRQVSVWNVIGFFHATNWYDVYNDVGYYIDLNGTLDGEMIGNLQNYATADVYINDELVADDVTDYYVRWPAGTRYRVTDIRTVDGLKFKDVYSDPLEGVVGNAAIDVRLNLVSMTSMDVNGLLDGEATDHTLGYGAFDVYIDGEFKAMQVTDFCMDIYPGSTYEIKNICPAEGKRFVGPVDSQLSGVIGKGGNIITLAFSTIEQAKPEWQEAAQLPENIDPATVEIQYKNRYEVVAETSPGEDWTQVPDSAEVTYENVGGIYESDFYLETSETRVYLDSFYYHYCNPSLGNRVNYAWTNDYCYYHTAYPPSSFNITGQWSDDDDPRYTANRLVWNTGEWAGGAATCATGSSDLWYLRHHYQDRQAVTRYKWMKESDWTDAADSEASSVTVRYRLKQYAVTFDANGGADAPQSAVKYHDVALTLPESAPVLADYGFVGWNTLADGTGKYYAAGSVYEENAPLALFAQWAPLSRMVLPAGVKAIDANAFENIGALVVEVPEGCLSIGEKAFLNCAKLTRLYLPASVESIAADAFEGCGSLTLCAPENSAAIRFAEEAGIPFEIVKE